MSKIYTGKTVDEAVKAGLSDLGLDISRVETIILDQGSKGFLGLGAKPARVQLIVKAESTEEKPERKKENTEKSAYKSVNEQLPAQKEEEKPVERKKEKPAKREKKERREPTDMAAEKVEIEPEVKVPFDPSEDAEKAKKFLEGLLSILNVQASVDIFKENSEKVVFIILTEDSSSVIGYRGEVLDSLQTLVGAVYNTDKEKYLRVVVDCEGYRIKREKTLVSLAKKLAQKAVATGRKITLEPMNPYERRIIHSALVDFEGVKTSSEGREPNRFVAIIPDGYDPSKAHKPGKFGGKGKGGKPFRGGKGGGAPKASSAPKSSGFGGGVFLGNSLKDKKDEE